MSRNINLIDDTQNMRKLKDKLPTREQIQQSRMLRIFGERLWHPEIWSLNRRSAPKGVAIGLFCGLIPGPLQVFGSVITSLFIRGNLPVAIFVTFYTNPLTIIPLYILAYQYGYWFLDILNITLPPKLALTDLNLPDWQWTHIIDSSKAYLQWFLDLGSPLAMGLLLLASTLSVTGFILTHYGWKLALLIKLKRKLKRNQQVSKPSK